MGLVSAIDFADSYADFLLGKKVGLLTNSAARTIDGRLSAQHLSDLPEVSLARIFAPEHGFDLTIGPGEDVADARVGGIRVVTLYGRRWAPESKHLFDLDLLIIDLPSLGVRCYTYLATALLSLRSAAKAACPVVILDRPNPLGRSIEAPAGKARDQGLLCPLAIPLRYGMTLGEVLTLAAREEGLPAPSVVACGQSDRPQPWYPPSPNLPRLESALVYPGTVLIEGTGLSEGRGTDAPFCNIGDPDLPGSALADFLGGFGFPGVQVRATAFVPQASKHAGRECQGVHITVTDRQRARPLDVTLHLLGWVRDHAPHLMQTNDLLEALWGGPQLRQWCESPDSPVEALTDGWQRSTLAFEDRRMPALLYAD